MGKMLSTALVSVFIIELALTYVVGWGITETGLYKTLIAPSDILTLGFYTIMLGVLAISTLAVITPGLFYSVNQWALFAVASGSMITFVATLAHLWSYIYAQLYSFPNIGGTFATLIATIITAPLIIYYIAAVVEWSRFNT